LSVYFPESINLENFECSSATTRCTIVFFEAIFIHIISSFDYYIFCFICLQGEAASGPFVQRENYTHAHYIVGCLQMFTKVMFTIRQTLSLA